MSKKKNNGLGFYTPMDIAPGEFSPTTDPYTGQDMRFGGDKPTLHDVVTGTEAGQTAAQAALDASMEAQRAVSGAGGLREIIKQELSKAYYNGLDRKGWSEYEEAAAIGRIEAAIAAYYEGLVPEKRKIATRDGFTGYGTPKLGVDLEAVGFNAAIDTIRQNFKGQPNEEESL